MTSADIIKISSQSQANGHSLSPVHPAINPYPGQLSTVSLLKKTITDKITVQDMDLWPDVLEKENVH
jgi:hypothetical protein